MSSEVDTYKVLIDRDLADPRKYAAESLLNEWPQDEWLKYVSVSVNGVITTMKLNIELHGSWVWELYNIMEPRDYFRRFEGAVIAVNPVIGDTFSGVPSFVESLDTYVGHRMPMIMAADNSEGLSEDIQNAVETLARQLGIPLIIANVLTGNNVESVFKLLAQDICSKVIL
jgi:hypothetical protein